MDASDILLVERRKFAAADDSDDVERRPSDESDERPETSCSFSSRRVTYAGRASRPTARRPTCCSCVDRSSDDGAQTDASEETEETDARVVIPSRHDCEPPLGDRGIPPAAPLPPPGACASGDVGGSASGGGAFWSKSDAAAAARRGDGG